MPMDHFQRIYNNEAETYHRFIAAEDAHGELARQLDRVARRATNIVDIGTGTGRLAIQLCRPGKRVHGVDVAADMLRVAAAALKTTPGSWILSEGDARNLPIEDDWADAALAGWVFGHFTEFDPEEWRTHLDRAIGEMQRVVRPGGTAIIIDTLGTAVEEPAAPAPLLAAYHSHIEEQGFARTVLRTDYRFDSVAESVDMLDWFFGLGEWAERHNDPVIPEFTGWWERSVG